MALSIDSDLQNADWIKALRWTLPPYKSEAFYQYLRETGMTLTAFKRLPIYKAAVQRGDIVDDEWAR